jgi:hypothetical protein
VTSLLTMLFFSSVEYRASDVWSGCFYCSWLLVAVVRAVLTEMMSCISVLYTARSIIIVESPWVTLN